MIAGRFRRRVLASVGGTATRPALGRIRQRLFDILQGHVEGRVFADLYAGTGAVGIEALSRGAERAVFVESDARALRVIRRNIAALEIADRSEVRNQRVQLAVRKISADIYFLGPPYDARLEYERTLNALGARSLDWAIAQHDRQLDLAETYGTLRKIRLVRIGRNRLSMYRNRHGEPEV